MQPAKNTTASATGRDADTAKEMPGPFIPDDAWVTEFGDDHREALRYDVTAV